MSDKKWRRWTAKCIWQFETHKITCIFHCSNQMSTANKTEQQPSIIARWFDLSKDWWLLIINTMSKITFSLRSDDTTFLAKNPNKISTSILLTLTSYIIFKKKELYVISLQDLLKFIIYVKDWETSDLSHCLVVSMLSLEIWILIFNASKEFQNNL